AALGKTRNRPSAPADGRKCYHPPMPVSGARTPRHTLDPSGRRYRRAVVPLAFPAEEQVPETTGHFELRTALYQVLKLAFGHRDTIGSDQFVYWDPTDPGQRLAPDVFVRLGQPHQPFGS